MIATEDKKADKSIKNYTRTQCGAGRSSENNLVISFTAK